MNSPLGTDLVAQLREAHRYGGDKKLYDRAADEIEKMTPHAESVTVEQMLALAVELERAQAIQVIADVAALAGDRTDTYWAAHAQACEEILHRLSQAYGATCAKCKEIAANG